MLLMWTGGSIIQDHVVSKVVRTLGTDTESEDNGSGVAWHV